MHWIVPAAGRGSRLTPYTDTKPKWLVELNGRSLCDRFLDTMRAAGHQDLNVVTGYRSKNLEEKFAGRPKTRLIHNPDWQETNMVHSISLAANVLHTHPCLISYSDIFFSGQAVNDLEQCPADIAICYDPDPIPSWARRYDNPLDDLETFQITGFGRIIEIGGKPKDTSDVGGQFMGLIKTTPNGWGTLCQIRDSFDADKRRKLDMTTLLSKAIASGIDIHGVPNLYPWGEIDTGDDLALYTALEIGEL